MAGRPKKAGPRHPGGRLCQNIAPPAEVLEQRARMVGEANERDQRAGYPLGILALKGLLQRADHSAGMRYGGLYIAIWGRGPMPSHFAAMMPELRGAEWELLDDKKREEILFGLAGDLGEATAVLLALSTRRPFEILVNLAVYERPMRFMDCARARSASAWAADQRDLDALKEATGRLATLWRIERKAA